MASHLMASHFPAAGDDRMVIGWCRGPYIDLLVSSTREEEEEEEEGEGEGEEGGEKEASFNHRKNDRKRHTHTVTRRVTLALRRRHCAFYRRRPED